MNLFKRKSNSTSNKEPLPRFKLEPSADSVTTVQPAKPRSEFELSQPPTQSRSATAPAANPSPANPTPINAAPVVAPKPAVASAKSVADAAPPVATTVSSGAAATATNSAPATSTPVNSTTAAKRSNPLRPGSRPPVTSAPAAPAQETVSPPAAPASAPRKNPLKPAVATANAAPQPVKQPVAAAGNAPTIPNSDRYMMVPGRRLPRPQYTIDPIISIKSVMKVYQMGDIEVQALRGVDLNIYAGEIIAIMGPSGSGKSTLMNVLGCLDVPSSGTYLLDGVDVNDLNDNELATIRSQKIGFVFQSFNLLARTTALANVELPLIYNGVRGRERHRRAEEVLSLVGLGNRTDHHPNELSGGQQQRVAIARALINRPAMILADEPTGNLDSKTRAEIMQLFQRLNREQNITVVFVTHDPETAEYCQRVVFIRDGLIARDEYREVTVGIYAPNNGTGANNPEEVEAAPSAEEVPSPEPALSLEQVPVATAESVMAEEAVWEDEHLLDAEEVLELGEEVSETAAMSEPPVAELVSTPPPSNGAHPLIEPQVDPPAPVAPKKPRPANQPVIEFPVF